MHVSTDIPSKEPLRFRAGETVKWDRDLSEHYPADDGWTLAYTIIDANTLYTVSSTADGDKFAVVIAKADSAKFAAGTYQLIGRVTKAGEEFGVYEGTLEIQPDVTAAVDVRSFAKRALDAIEAVLEGRITSDVLQYSIAGRLVVKMPPEELHKYRDRFKAEYNMELRKESIARGESTGGRVLVRFG